MKLGVSLPVFTADPARPLAVARAGRGARVRRRVLARPLLPAGVLPAVRPGPSRARGVHDARGRRGAAPRAARRDARRARDAARAGAAGEAGGGARRDERRPGDPRARHRRRRIASPSTRCTGSRIRARAERRRAARGDRARAPRAVRRRGRGPGERTCPRSTGPLLPPGAPALWVGGRSDAVLAVAARVADAWNGWGRRRRGVRGEGGPAPRARGRPRRSRRRGAGIALVGRGRGGPRAAARRRARRRACRPTASGPARPPSSRAFVDALGERGRDVVRRAAGGPADRLDVIAAALIGSMNSAELKRAKRAVRGRVLAARDAMPAPNARERVRARSPSGPVAAGGRARVRR